MGPDRRQLRGALLRCQAGLIGLTKALAKEEGPSGITVNCVAPGVIDTDMMAAFTAEDKAALAEETPVGRLGSADEVAQLLVFLAGESAGYSHRAGVRCERRPGDLNHPAAAKLMIRYHLRRSQRRGEKGESEMGMTLKELLTKGEGTLTAGEAKTLASQCRMDVETLYTLLEERGIKILDDEADGDTSLDVEGIMAEVESAEANSDELGLGDENEDDPAEENPADLKAAMDELLDDPVKNYLKQIGQIPLLSAEQEVDLSKRIHAGAEAAHILQADRQKYGAPEYIKKNSARFSFEEDENSRSYTEDLDEEGNTKSSEDDEEKAAEEEPWSC